MTAPHPPTPAGEIFQGVRGAVCEGRGSRGGGGGGRGGASSQGGARGRESTLGGGCDCLPWGRVPAGQLRQLHCNHKGIILNSLFVCCRIIKKFWSMKINLNFWSMKINLLLSNEEKANYSIAVFYWQII